MFTFSSEFAKSMIKDHSDRVYHLQHKMYCFRVRLFIILALYYITWMQKCYIIQQKWSNSS